jgi:HEAT repeat protein
MNRIIVTVLLACIIGSLSTASARAETPDFTPTTRFSSNPYASDYAMRLLVDLLDAPDRLTRVGVVNALGETDNPAAIDALRRAADDTEPMVRGAAATAAARLQTDGAAEIILARLSDADDAVVLRALDAVRRLTPAETAPVVDLLDHRTPLVRAAALWTLSSLDRPAPAGRLVELSADPVATVRLRALENARLLDDGSAVVERAQDIAASQAPAAVRAAAIELLGKFAFDSSKPVLANAAQADHVLLRRGAARAYTHAGQSDHVVRMLDDDSPIVRLAAIRGTEKLKPADAIDRLTELMIAAPDDQTHTAARNALLSIGTDDVAASVAKALPALVKALQSGPDAEHPNWNRRSEQLDRNAITCCDILAVIFADRPDQAASLPGTDTMLDMLRKLGVAQLPLGAAGDALGAIGDARAVPLLTKTLDTCVENGRKMLIAQLAMRPGPPYSGEVTGRICRGLAAFGRNESVPHILGITKVNVQRSRLGTAARYAMDALPDLATPENRDAIAEELLTVLADGSGFGTSAKAHAARAAVRMDLDAASEPLAQLLEYREGGRAALAVFAWAQSQLTDTNVPAPDPLPKAGSEWIIRPMER